MGWLYHRAQSAVFGEYGLPFVFTAAFISLLNFVFGYYVWPKPCNQHAQAVRLAANPWRSRFSDLSPVILFIVMFLYYSHIGLSGSGFRALRFGWVNPQSG
jgi:hypothetical protein